MSHWNIEMEGPPYCLWSHIGTLEMNGSVLTVMLTVSDSLVHPTDRFHAACQFSLGSEFDF